MSLDVQRFIAALVVEPQLFGRFRESQLECAQSFGLNPRDARMAAGTNLSQLAVFRDVVEGTRAIQFQNWFPSVTSVISEECWIRLIQDFHAQVCVRSSKRFNDANLFCDWVAARFPRTLALDMVIHDLAVVIASGALRCSGRWVDEAASRMPRIMRGGKSWTLRPDAVPFSLQRPIASLQQTGAEVFSRNTQRESGAKFYYLVHAGRTGDGADDALNISELDPPTHSFVMQLFVPPWQKSDHATSVLVKAEEGVAIDALMEAQVLITSDAQLQI